MLHGKGNAKDFCKVEKPPWIIFIFQKILREIKGVVGLKLVLEFGMGAQQMNNGTGEQWDWEKINAQLSQKLTVPEKTAPQDLELLSLMAGRFNGQESLSFMDSREGLHQNPKSGAFIMSRQWLEYFHAVPEEKTDALLEAWCEEVNKTYADAELSPDDVLKEFVVQLKGLCKQALAEEKQLIQLWFFR